MAEYLTRLEIASADDAEMLAALEWIKDNHAAKVTHAQADGNTKVVTLSLVDATFTEGVNSITAFKNQFTTRLGDNWSLTMQ